MTREIKASNNSPKILLTNNKFQVQIELDKLQTNLEVIDKDFCQLEERFSSVLKTHLPMVAINEEKPELVELASRLFDANIWLCKLVNRINNTIDQCQL